MRLKLALSKGTLHVMALMRTTAGINKAEDAGATHGQIGFADALRWIFPPVLARYVVFHGWIRQETLCDRSSVTFDLRQCALGQVAQVVEEQEVEVVQLAQPAGQIQVALGGKDPLRWAAAQPQPVWPPPLLVRHTCG